MNQMCVCVFSVCFCCRLTLKGYIIQLELALYGDGAQPLVGIFVGDFPKGGLTGPPRFGESKTRDGDARIMFRS